MILTLRIIMVSKCIVIYFNFLFILTPTAQSRKSRFFSVKLKGKLPNPFLLYVFISTETIFSHQFVSSVCIWYCSLSVLPPLKNLNKPGFYCSSLYWWSKSAHLRCKADYLCQENGLLYVYRYCLLSNHPCISITHIPSYHVATNQQPPSTYVNITANNRTLAGKHITTYSPIKLCWTQYRFLSDSLDL